MYEVKVRFQLDWDNQVLDAVFELWDGVGVKPVLTKCAKFSIMDMVPSEVENMVWVTAKNLCYEYERRKMFEQWVQKEKLYVLKNSCGVEG